MRRVLPLALLLLGACAPAGTGTVPVPRGPNANRVITAEGRAASFGSGDEMYAAPERIAAPRASVWDAIVAAYAATQLPIEVVDQAGGQIAARFSVYGDMMGVPVSTFLTCGGAMGVAEVADAYQVEVQLQILVIPEGKETELRMRLGGSARDRFTNTDPRPCLTKGILENRLAARVRDRLGIANPATLAEQAAQAPALSALEPQDELEEMPAAAESIVLPPSHPLLLTVGGAAGGAIGSLVGAKLGEDCTRRCFNARGALGPLVANTVLIPLGTHLTNRQRGRLVKSFIASAGWAVLATVVGGFTGEDWPVYAVAPGQLLTSVIIERSSTRKRAEEGS